MCEINSIWFRKPLLNFHNSKAYDLYTIKQTQRGSAIISNENKMHPLTIRQLYIMQKRIRYNLK